MTSFNNEGDVYSAGRDIKIGLGLEEMIRLMELGSLEKAKSIPYIRDVVFNLYGRSLENLIDSGVSQDEIWSKIYTALKSTIRSSINIEDLTEKDLNNLQKFYDALRSKEFDDANELISDELKRLEGSENNLAFILFLKSEVKRAKYDFNGAVSLILEAIDICYSEIYLLVGLAVAANDLRRVDLIEVLLSKMPPSKELMSIYLRSSLIEILAQFGSHEEAIVVGNNFLESTKDEVSESVKIERVKVRKSIVSATLKKERFLEKDQFEELLAEINDLDVLIGQLGMDEDFRVRAVVVEHNKSATYLGYFELLFESINHATIHPVLVEEGFDLSKSEEFIYTNYLNPLYYLSKAIDHCNEVVRLKEVDEELSVSIDVTYANRALLLVRMYKLKILLAWKIEYVCKKLELDYDAQVGNFENMLSVEGVVERIKDDMDFAIDIAKKKESSFAEFIVNVADFFKIHVRDLSVANKYYREALFLLDKHMIRSDLYNYLMGQLELK